MKKIIKAWAVVGSFGEGGLWSLGDDQLSIFLPKKSAMLWAEDNVISFGEKASIVPCTITLTLQKQGKK